jgi:hypothetical protein
VLFFYLTLKTFGCERNQKVELPLIRRLPLESVVLLSPVPLPSPFPKYRIPMDGMTRSEVAEKAGVNPETLRYYEREALIPEPPRSDGGFRLYDASYVDRLRFIQRAKDLGFALAEISGRDRNLPGREGPRTGEDRRGRRQDSGPETDSRLRFRPWPTRARDRTGRPATVPCWTRWRTTPPSALSCAVPIPPNDLARSPATPPPFALITNK